MTHIKEHRNTQKNTATNTGKSLIYLFVWGPFKGVPGQKGSLDKSSKGVPRQKGSLDISFKGVALDKSVGNKGKHRKTLKNIEEHRKTQKIIEKHRKT